MEPLFNIHDIARFGGYPTWNDSSIHAEDWNPGDPSEDEGLERADDGSLDLTTAKEQQ